MGDADNDGAVAGGAGAGARGAGVATPSSASSSSGEVTLAGPISNPSSGGSLSAWPALAGGDGSMNVPVTTGRYVALAEIGAGGMGVIYRATDTALGRELALKVLQDQYDPSSVPTRRFQDEARITGRLQHPCIPPVHDLGVLPDGRPFLAMKLIGGQTLDALLRERTTPADDRGRFVAVFEQACHAIAYAHAHGVVHRDVKPGNIMVGAFGEVQVMDWGLAKVLGEREAGAVVGGERDEGESAESRNPRSKLRGLSGARSSSSSSSASDPTVTQAGAVLGTPAFMAPEQAAGGSAAADERGDVFGLGAVLAVVLTGRPPFAGESSEATRVMAARGSVADCFARLDACGAEPELVALCKRCLAPEPGGRPADGGEVARAVTELRQAAEERARRAELERVRADGERAAAEVRAAEQRKRRHTQAALGISLTAAVLLAGVFAWWVSDQRRAARELAERDVARAIQSAEAKYAQARGADRDPALWADARAAAAQAVDRAGGAPGDARERARALLAEIEQVGKNRRLVATLLAIQAGMGDELTANGNQDFAAAHAKYAAAFREYGADIEAIAPDAAATLLRSLGGASAVELAAALDDWAYVRALAKVQGAKSLFDVTRRLDPDELRTRIRDAVDAQDVPGLTAVGRQVDPAVQPVQTVNLCSVWIWWLTPGAEREARLPDTIAFLTRARAHYPSDFQINHNLAFYLNRKRAYADALAYGLSAVAIRPDSQAAWLDCARAYEGLGRRAEAAAAYRRMAGMGPGAWRYRVLAGHHLTTTGDAAGAQAEYRLGAAAAPRDPSFDKWLAELATTGPNAPFLDELVAGFRGAVTAEPGRAAGHGRLGLALLARGDLAGARAALREAHRLDPAAMPAAPDVYAKPLTRAGLFAELAAVRGRDASKVTSGERMCTATLLLHAGDLAGYRRACAEMFGAFEKSVEPADADRTAKAILLAPESAEWLGRARALAKRATTGTESHQFYRLFMLSKALAEYRGGEYAAAAATVRDGYKPSATGGHFDASTLAVLAMALHREGKAAEAKAALATARAIVAARMPDPEKGRPFDPAGGWCDWLQAGMLVREAEGALGGGGK